MEVVLEPFHQLLELNTRLFVHCLEGVDDETARKRINTRTNNVAFIASHVLDARYFLANYLGDGVVNPYKELLEGLRSIEEFTEFPVVQEVLAAWADVSGRLSERFGTLAAEDLRQPSPRPFPIGDTTILGGVAFLVQHESYHLGQLGFLRKCFELGPMSYSA